MPGDLNDPDSSPFPGYHPDGGNYERGQNQFEPGTENFRKYLQKIVLERGVRLSPQRLDDLVLYLDNAGILHRNHGDEAFRNKIFEYINKIQKAKKVASQWLT